MILRAEEITLREGDAQECANAGMTPQEAVEKSVALSQESYVAKHKGQVLAYWGWSTRFDKPSFAYVWMLSAPAMDRWPTHAARESLRLRDLLLERYSELECLVDPGYTKATRWLEWLGFRSLGSLGPFMRMGLKTGGRA